MDEAESPQASYLRRNEREGASVLQMCRISGDVAGGVSSTLARRQAPHDRNDVELFCLLVKISSAVG